MRWQLAFAQHPMYLIIRECATCAERTLPWGESTIELYVDRVHRNIATLRAHPELKLGYEWSGLELEQLAADAPDVLAELRALAADGRVAFYNATYAQPHLQTLSSEANLRQFEHGARALRELCGWQVNTYAHQEASVHDQLPQLLRAFGIRFAVVPRFASTLTWLEGGELLLFDLSPCAVKKLGGGPGATRGSNLPGCPIVLRALLYSVFRLVLDALVDRRRSDATLRLELLVLRHQLRVLERQVRRPTLAVC